jgi:hypothetical protein
MSGHGDEERQAQRILSSMAESRKPFTGTDEELRSELPRPAEAEPHDPAAFWGNLVGRWVGIFMMVTVLLIALGYLDIPKP